MNKCAGFSIIECLIYCFLLCLLGVMVFDWVGASQVSLIKIQHAYRNTLEVCCALDAFARDAMSAPSEKRMWKKISESQLIWQSPEGAVGWIFENGSLYRITGTYSKQWIQSRKNLISNTLTHARFALEFDRHGQVLLVSSNFDKAQRSVSIRNRSIHGSA